MFLQRTWSQFIVSCHVGPARPISDALQVRALPFPFATCGYLWEFSLFSHLGMETLLTFSVDNQLWNADIKLIPCIPRVLEHQESSMLILGKNEDGILGYAVPFLWFDRSIQCLWDIVDRYCPIAVKNVRSITFRFEWNHLTCNGYRGTHYLISWWWRKHLLPSQGPSPTNDTLDTLPMFCMILDIL